MVAGDEFMPVMNRDMINLCYSLGDHEFSTILGSTAQAKCVCHN